VLANPLNGDRGWHSAPIQSDRKSLMYSSHRLDWEWHIGPLRIDRELPLRNDKGFVCVEQANEVLDPLVSTAESSDIRVLSPIWVELRTSLGNSKHSVVPSLPSK